jgi:branched-chain amino acid transport system ATP-binding protein
VTLLAVEGLTVRYGQLTALRETSLALAEGETLFVTGPNGAGKSTLMKAIAGVVAPAAGRIRFAGEDVTGLAPEAIARLGISMVPEGRQVFGSLTVEENLRLGAGMRGDRAAAARDLAAAYASFPMLAERRHGQAGLLSGGQQQMLVIARALMTAPRLVAIDEPSLGLAPVVIDGVYDLLLRLRAERGLTLLIVEQSSTRAMMTGGRMLMLRSGRIVLEGDARELGRSGAAERAYFGYEEAPA